MLRDVFYFNEKPNAHPRESKAKDLVDARAKCTTEHFWIINEFCDYQNFDWDFDFDLLPDEDVWSQEHTNIWPSSHQKDSGTWLCPKQSTDIMVYRTDVNPLLRKNEINENWVIHESIIKSKFDFSWHPDPTDPPYIYVWGNKFFPGEIKPTIEYVVRGATDKKFMGNDVELLPDENWIEVQKIDNTRFDMSWRPDPTSPPYIYIWGNRFIPGEIKSTLEYHTPGAKEIKYMPEPVEVLPDENWIEIQKIDKKKFDLSWRPDPREPPFIYVWGNKFIPGEIKSTLEYHTEGSTQKKFMPESVEVLPEWDNWVVGSQYNNFDYSWRPDPTSPPYIYQFGTLLDKNDGPKYVTPGNNGEIVYLKRNIDESLETVKIYKITSTLEDLIQKHPDELFWAIRENIEYQNFDFDWRPIKIETEYENTYLHVFGSAESEITQTYFVNSRMYNKGHTDKKFVENKKLDQETLSKLFIKPDMFFVDKGNEHASNRYEQIKTRFPNIQKTRYLNSWVETINRCINKSTTQLCWILSSEIDYSAFDFDYYPNPWQMKMVHVFGTQWTHWGNTYLVNKETFGKDTKYVKIIEHLNNLNFLKTKKAKAVDCLYDVYLIKHENYNDEIKYKLEKQTGKKVTVINYVDDYLNTFRQMLELLPDKKEHFIWVCSSICDYSYFDFTYICDPFSKEQLHVFPSDRQKFGDTFLVNVNALKELIKDIDCLSDLKRINFNNHQRTFRVSPPVFVSDDTHVEFGTKRFNHPYAIFKTHDNKDISIDDTEPMSLWDQKSKNINIKSTGGSCVVIPKDAIGKVKTELYDYLYIKTDEKLAKSKPLDIIFISNGEKIADSNYDNLLRITKHLPNRVLRLDGINGRVNSQHAAANLSETPWYFLINAKLRVDKNFDFSWQPDRLQIPKHYIFHATNPLNGLVYGHQAIVVNNKKLTLNTVVKGLDFTMDSQHEVVEINSGVGMYNTSEWDTWRTAFRECIKLLYNSTDENKTRLKAWLNIAEGDYALYSIQGAKDAIQYFNQVEGSLEKLMLSYDWAWLREYYDNRIK